MPRKSPSSVAYTCAQIESTLQQSDDSFGVAGFHPADACSTLKLTRCGSWSTPSRSIATLGGSPVGTPGALVAQRSWDDYSIGRAGTLEHLAALDVVYAGVIEAQREAIEATEELDQVTQDMLIEQSGQLEQFHWFVRAHLESADGSLATAGARTEKSAAKRAAKR